MLAMVARSGTVRLSRPSPPYSKTWPTLPRVVKISRSFRITSLAETQGGSFPVRFTRITRGQVRKKGSPAMASATSSPPAPMASMPRAPQVEVWLSEPRRVFPGLPNRSRCTWWQMPFPARERRMP